MVGGGRVFGPVPRDYSFKLNKKLKLLARKSAFSYKAKDEQIIILEDFSFEVPKTKEYLELTNNLKISDKKSIIVLAEPNKNVYLSARNLQNSKVLIVSEINTYKILDAKVIVLTEGALVNIEKNLKA
jgi:large subunit ribosomal protein L4